MEKGFITVSKNWNFAFCFNGGSFFKGRIWSDPTLNQQKECRSYELLGIFLDEHLTLDAHSNHIVSKLSRSLYCIKQAKHIIPAHGLKSLYFALIHSHLTYCSLIMHGTSAKNRNKIIKIQKKAIRIMTNSNYNANTNPLYIEHGILPYDLLIKQSQLLFMHSIVLGPPGCAQVFPYLSPGLLDFFGGMENNE